jgi:hypothetical protein
MTAARQREIWLRRLVEPRELPHDPATCLHCRRIAETVPQATP